jgi:hypothetical protein
VCGVKRGGGLSRVAMWLGNIIANQIHVQQEGLFLMYSKKIDLANNALALKKRSEKLPVST